MLKVFKMNEYDWVASKTPEEAKAWYLEEMQVDEDSIDEPIEECDIYKEGLYVPVSELTEEELKLHKIFKQYSDEIYAWYSFADVLKEHDSKETYIIASTEC